MGFMMCPCHGCFMEPSQAMRPKFDPTEEYLISWYRTVRTKRLDGRWMIDAAYLVSGFLVLLWGIHNDDTTWILIGFGIVAYRLLQLTVASGKYNPTVGGIIEKYEQSYRPEAGSSDADKE